MTAFLTELPWGWYAGGLCLIVGLLHLANWYLDHVTEDVTPEPPPCSPTAEPLDWRTIEDIRWTEIEQQWHEFIDSFGVRP